MPQINRQMARPHRSLPPARREGASPASAWDLASHLRVLVYGRSGAGKTTFWGTFPGRVLALICSGSSRPGELRSIDTPGNRERIDARVIRSVAECRGLVDEAGGGGYGTIVLDHASGLQDMALKEVLGLEELPAQKVWGMARQQDYGQSTLQCKEFLRALLNVPANVVIVAQERSFGGSEDGAVGGGEVLAPTIGPSVTPSLASWLCPACDYVLHAFLRPRMERVMRKVAGKDVVSEERGRGVEHCLRLREHDLYMTKFRAVRGREVPEVMVDPSYAKLMEALGEGASG